MLIKIKNLIIDILFPKFCFCCKKEGNYLCQDCEELTEVSSFHENFCFEYLNDLYFSNDYKNFLVKKLIRCFKYQPFAKELAKPISCLIIKHLELMDNKPDFSSFVLMPVPLYKKRMKWRGFNQSEKLAEELAGFLQIPLILNCLEKIKETFPQTELAVEERKENIKNSFCLKNKNLVKNKNILLVDDVYTSGATMQECARILKKADAKKVIGIVLARG